MVTTLPTKGGGCRQRDQGGRRSSCVVHASIESTVLGRGSRKLRDEAVPHEDVSLGHEATRSSATARMRGRRFASSSRARTVTMCRATRSASRPAPPTSIDANECKKGRPAKETHGSRGHGARY